MELKELSRQASAPLHVQPLPDDRFRFKVEGPHGKVIGEVTLRSGSARQASVGPFGEAAALAKALELVRALEHAIHQRLVVLRTEDAH